MSLINQVLQDLDRRRAMPATMPTAARGVQARSAWRGSRRWAGATGAALAGAAFACAGALAWNHAQSTAGEAYVPSTSRPVAATPLPGTSSIATTTAAPGVAMAAPAAATPAAVSAAQAVAFPQAVAPSPVVVIAPQSLAAAAAVVNAAPSVATAPAVVAAAALATAAPAPLAAPSPIAVTPAANADVRVALAPVRATSAPRISVPAAADADRTAPLPALAPAGAATPPVQVRVEKRPAPTTPRERAEAAYQRGLGLHAQGRIEDGEAAFMNALQEDRAHAPARLALAVSLAGHGAAEEARNLLADGLELQPRQLALASTLARLKSQNHDLPGAIATLKSAIAAGAAAAPASEQAPAFALLATLQQSALQHAPAIENYAAALRLAPNNGAWWIGMGLSLAADGRPESAREAYARARSTESLSAELQQFVDQRLR